MARHAQPIELAKLKGADKKDPQRYNDRKAAPKNDKPLGDPPPHMKKEVVKIWRELEAAALPGVLTASERLFFEMTAELFAEFRKSPKNFQSARFGQLVSCLARLGMTPADRQKLGVEKKKDDDDGFDEF